MPKQRYEISDADWESVSDRINSPRRTERPRADDRLMLIDMSWMLCSGAAWRDMPERYGSWSTVYQRFRDWRNQDTYQQDARVDLRQTQRVWTDRSGCLVH